MRVKKATYLYIIECFYTLFQCIGPTRCITFTEHYNEPGDNVGYDYHLGEDSEHIAKLVAIGVHKNSVEKISRDAYLHNLKRHYRYTPGSIDRVYLKIV